ncbi:MAG: tetratricopeptide repeat protein [Symploca sp. SIO2E6]|nr:tetratricopeptide repeat protein [Symploca sp. SIO2E6]
MLHSFLLITHYSLLITYSANPNYAYTWHGRGSALCELGKHQEAIASFDKALKIQPDFTYAWNYRGWALENLKRYNEALKSYEKAIQFDSNNRSAIDNRKRLLKKPRR